MASKKQGGKIVYPTVILNDVYQVVLDPHCYILQKAILPEDDEELTAEEKKSNFKTLGYFSTWEHLSYSLSQDIQRLKASKLNKESRVTLNEFLDIVKETRKEVSKMFDEIDKQTKVKKESKK